VGPAPPHTVGLRGWSVELPSSADVVDVERRVEAAELEVAPVEGGFRVRDPWQISLDVVAAGSRD
jgi:hypothetical protein